jgi:hypothetical protein
MNVFSLQSQNGVIPDRITLRKRNYVPLFIYIKSNILCQLLDSVAHPDSNREVEPPDFYREGSRFESKI